MGEQQPERETPLFVEIDYRVVLDEFLAVTAPEQIAPFCMRHCPVCRGLSAQEGAHFCLLPESRCWLRHWDNWRGERACSGALRRAVLMPGTASLSTLIEQFNVRLAATGAATVGLQVHPGGDLALAFNATTLLGVLQGGLWAYLAGEAGILPLNVKNTGTKSAREIVGKTRGEASDTLQEQAKVLWAHGRSYTAISKLLGKDRTTIKQWVNPKRGY